MKKAIIRDGKIIYGDDISPTIQKPNELSAMHNREAQKVQFRKELTQPVEIAYAKAYPEDFKKRYGNEEYRRFS